MNQYLARAANYNSQKSFYRPELDVFRAIAILLVICAHWFPVLNKPIDLGTVGVTAFFVLSGFLITTILCRAASELNRNNVLTVAYSFFARRILRLLPAYYFALLIAWGLQLPYLADAWPWFVLHGANIYLFQRQQWGEGMGHFWSLAVEEQFYLFWPAVTLLLPKRRLRFLLGLLVVAGPFVRWYLLQRTNAPFALILTPACLDLFAMGAGLSLVFDNLRLRGYFWLGAIVVSSSIYYLLETGSYSLWFLVIGPSILALAAAASIALVLTTDFAPARWVLHQPVILAVGRLSYGLYLYHLFMPIILHRCLHHLGRFIAQGRYYNTLLVWERTLWAGLLMGLMVLGLAVVSWQLIEQPFLRLQRFFPYEKIRVKANR